VAVASGVGVNPGFGLGPGCCVGSGMGVVNGVVADPVAEGAGVLDAVLPGGTPGIAVVVAVGGASPPGSGLVGTCTRKTGTISISEVVS
jgi:hypothetical protein